MTLCFGVVLTGRWLYIAPAVHIYTGATMTIAILSCSLNPQSRSYVLARQVESYIREREVAVQFFDLRTCDLDFCGRPEARNRPDVKVLQNAIQQAAAVLMAVPIYNYDVNAAAKNLIELTGRAWTYKPVGFMCAAGGQSSYMSLMSLANSLMLDFRCFIIPRFVYATGEAFGKDRTPDIFVADENVRERLRELADVTIAMSRALKPVIETLPQR